MGAKHASIHFRSDTPDNLIPILKKIFGKKPKPDKQEIWSMKLIETVAQGNINKITDEKERTEKQAQLDLLLNKAKNDMEDGEKAVIVIQEHFVSLYWYDHIRNENLERMLYSYAEKTKTPALGVGVYDDNNFIIHAVRDVGKGSAEQARGVYWFEHDDIQPVEAAELTRILGADFLLAALKKTLSCEDGETMAEMFEENTGLLILMNADDCLESGMTKIAEWGGADLFRAQ